ncbi:MAG: Outer membrane chaperone Skp (OmpH) [Bacteroidetes bacterium 38_7]|nr:MAG: Outer membrane chaperone Skp (OmpH) [Bacteroidetes bacterium 38_7]HAL64826.1 hypothetical protein [Bacteroidales bacterium]
MKNKSNLSLILSVISLVGVVILFVLYFMEPSNGKKGVPKAFESEAHRIAFFRTDSILYHYDFVKERADELAQKSRKYGEDLQRRQAEFENEAAYFQESVRKNALSEKSAQEIYQELMQKQQSILDLKDRYDMELANEEAQINFILFDSVSNLLKRYNKNLGYDYILGYNKNGNIFYTNDTFDITPEVIKELNKEYQTMKSKTTPPSGKK